MKDEEKRFIFLYGGSSSAKSYSVSQCVLLKTLEEGSNTLVLRKVGSTIKNSIYEDFKTNAERMGILDQFKFQQNTIKCLLNGAKIDFSGLDDPEKIKGIANYKRVVLEELSEFNEADFKQIRKRLRGKRGQQIISMFNPISENHWIKLSIFDKEKLESVSTSIEGIDDALTKIASKRINSEKTILNPKTKKEEVHPPDTVILQSTYLDNFWIVGSPDGSYGYYDRQVVADFEKDRINDYDYYRIYALGEWGSIRTGGEFLGSFDQSKHCGEFRYVSGYPIHVSIDNNVLPYISVSIWQVVTVSGVEKLRQIHEICAEDPFNTVTKASEMFRLWLDSIGYDNVVYVYGDATTRAGNTIDDEKRSFLDKFIDGINSYYRVEDRIPKSNPPVAISGEFVNAILSDGVNGVGIEVNETCKNSVTDYENVKKDVNGGILKTRIKNKVTMQSYEQYGHLTDTLRYVCTSVFKDKFTRFSLRRKRNTNQEDDMKYYNVDLKSDREARIVYVMPYINEKTVLVCGDVHDHVDISSVLFCPALGQDEIIATLKELKADSIVFECDKSHFQMVREIREVMDVDIRASTTYANKHGRISANEDFIKKSFRFRSDYDTNDDYVALMDNIMDYNGKDNFEAIGCLSALSVYVQRNYFKNK